MRILFLTWKDIKHPFAGGAEKVMLSYAKGLVKKGHEVTWFASSFEGGKNNEKIDGIKIIRKYNLNNIYFLAWKWYKEYKKNNKIDLIIDEAGGIPLLSPLYKNNVPVIFFIHHVGDKEWDEKFIFPINIIAKFVFHKIICLYKKVKTITISNSTKDELIKKFGFKKQNIKIIESACDIKPIKEINFTKKENSILFLGRLMPIKRAEHAILAFNKFIKSNKIFNNYILNIVGNDQDKKYVEILKKLIKKLELTNQINMCGHISKEDFKNFVSKHKILLVPSIKEGFGLIVLEGNCYGLPTIGYNVAGLKDSIKEGVNGFLVKDGDYTSMGNKITEILGNINFYKKISKNSLNYVKKLDSWDKKVNEFEKIILNLQKSKG